MARTDYLLRLIAQRLSVIGYQNSILLGHAIPGDHIDWEYGEDLDPLTDDWLNDLGVWAECEPEPDETAGRPRWEDQMAHLMQDQDTEDDDDEPW